MIEWATSDVDRLFDVAAKQLDSISDMKKTRAIDKSNKNTSFAHDMDVEQGLTVKNIGWFIGKRGANLRSLQRSTGTLIYQERPKNTWVIFYSTRDGLNSVKSSMSR